MLVIEGAQISNYIISLIVESEIIFENFPGIKYLKIYTL